MKSTTDNSWMEAGLGLTILVCCVWAVVATFSWLHNRTGTNNPNRPWWTGTSSQTVCAIDQPTAPSRQCYTLQANSDGTQVTAIYFENGGHITAASSNCYKAGNVANYGNDRFCRVYDAQGRQWEVDHQ